MEYFHISLKMVFFLENVSIVISQNGTVIGSTLLTDASGDASTTVNAGIYSITFSYPNRLPVTTELTINYDNTHLVFAFPNLQSVGCRITNATPYFSQALVFHNYATDYAITAVMPTRTTTPVFTNHA
jgi:hypothetical protein